jgi:hypothetical protein
MPSKAKNKKIDLDDEEILSEEADGVFDEQDNGENGEESKDKYI